MKLRVRRKPKEIIVERWDGPARLLIPAAHTLHGGSRVYVEPGDYIAKPNSNDWYPVKAEVLARDFDILGEACESGAPPSPGSDAHLLP